MEVFRDPSVPLTDGQLTLRRQVYKEISSSPETFDMATWEVSYDESGVHTFARDACRTTRCIAGWTAYYAGIPVSPLVIEGKMALKAVALLGLTRDEYYHDGDRYDATGLFHDSNEHAVARMRALAGEG